jgi:DNA-binding CsgD family transcriptional regulator
MPYRRAVAFNEGNAMTERNDSDRPTFTIGSTTYKILFPEFVPHMSEEEFHEFKRGIRENPDGIEVPIDVDENDGVIDGFHRLRAAFELGWEEVPVLVHEGLTLAQKRALSDRRNNQRRQQTPEQRKQRREKQARKTVSYREQGKSQEWIAGRLGISQPQVSRYLAEANLGGPNELFARIIPPEQTNSAPEDGDSPTAPAEPKRKLGRPPGSGKKPRPAPRAEKAPPPEDPEDDPPEEELAPTRPARKPLLPGKWKALLHKAGDAFLDKMNDIVPDREDVEQSPTAIDAYCDKLQSALTHYRRTLLREV